MAVFLFFLVKGRKPTKTKRVPFLGYEETPWSLGHPLAGPLFRGRQYDVAGQKPFTVQLQDTWLTIRLGRLERRHPLCAHQASACCQGAAHAVRPSRDEASSTRGAGARMRDEMLLRAAITEGSKDHERDKSQRNVGCYRET